MGNSARFSIGGIEMNGREQLEFEIYVMDLTEHCKTTEDYERLAMELHESIENAIQDV